MSKLTILLDGKQLATWEGDAAKVRQLLDFIPEVAAVTGITCEVFAEASIKNFYELAREGLHDAARYGLLWKILTMPWASGKLADYVGGGADYRADVSSDSGRVRFVFDT